MPITQGCKLWRRKFFGVTWINFIVRYRNIWVTIAEILFPILVMGICLLGLNSNLEWSLDNGEKIVLSPDAQLALNEGGNSFEDRRQFLLQNSKLTYGVGEPNGAIAYISYSPDKPFTNDLMRKVSKYLFLDPDRSLHPAQNESELLLNCREVYADYIENKDKSNNLIQPIGIVFEKDGLSDDKVIMRSDFSYKIRTFLDEIGNTAEIFPYYTSLKLRHDISPYIKSGFIALQSAIDRAYLDTVFEWLTLIKDKDLGEKNTLLYSTQIEWRLKMFPYTIYLDNKVRFNTWFYILTSFTISFMLTNFIRTRQLIRDHTSGILELLKMHGLKSSIYYASGIVNEVVLRMFTSVFLTLLFFSSLAFTGGFFVYSNGIIIWAILVLHSISETALSYTIAHFFQNGAFGACTVDMVCFLSYIIPMSLYHDSLLRGKILNIILCILLPYWNLANGIYDFLKFESYDAGLSWVSLGTWTDEFLCILPTGFVIVTAIASCIFYSVIAIYLDHVRPKALLPRKGYFFFCKKCGQLEAETVEPSIAEPEFVKPKIYETLVGKQAAIICKRVTFTYSGNDLNLILNDFSAEFFKNQVAVLVGRTGCGKSTLLKLLGLIYPPDEGTVHLQGYEENLLRKFPKQFIGILPENHALYENLTVEEHIRFCCLLHGRTFKNARSHAVSVMIRFKIINSRGVGIKYLNEPMKRRVSIAIAMANGPTILLLDSPTLGMDFEDRKDIWSIISSFKPDRCIIVTASTLDEAELFADRILLIDNGKLIACGSPNFLRQNYSTGTFIKLYHPEDAEVNSKKAIVAIVKGAGGKHAEHIREVVLKGFEHHSRATYFSLPHTGVKYSKILEELEFRKNEIGYSKMTVTHVTLAGVLHQFTHTPSEGPTEQIIGEKKSDDSLEIEINEMTQPDNELPTFPPEFEKQPSYFGNMIALTNKQSAIIRQKYKWIFMDFLIPLIMVAVFMSFSLAFFGHEANDVSLPLSAQTYPKSKLPVLMYIHERIELKKWIYVIQEVLKETRGRIVFFSPSIEESKKFDKMFIASGASLSDVSEQVVVGISRDHSTYSGFYASNALHAAPSVYNIMTNIYLYLLTPDKDKYNTYMRLHTFNHPFRIHNETRTGTVRETTDTMIGILFSLPIALYAATKIGQGFQEKLSGTKWLQTICGVTPVQYWLVLFVADFILTLFFASFFIGVICVLDLNRLFRETKATLFLMIIVYTGWAFPPMAYLISQHLPSTFSVQAHQIFVHIFLGILPVLLSHLFFRNQLILTGLITSICSVFPSFTITSMLVKYFTMISSNSFCDFIPLDSKSLCFNYEYSQKHYHRDSHIAENDVYFKSCCEKYCKAHGSCHERHDLIGWWRFGESYELTEADLFLGFITLFFQGVFYWTILLCFEYNIFGKAYRTIRQNIIGDTEATRVMQIADYAGSSPKEITEEMDRVNRLSDAGLEATHDEAFFAKNISKFFGSEKVLDHIYFSVRKGSVLGFVGGVNAGKSVFMKIVTGEIKSSGGTGIIVDGKGHSYSLDKNKSEYLKRISVCPRNEVLCPHLTGLQMMHFIGTLRGIPTQYLDFHVAKWLRIMGFDKQLMNRLCSHYPPGMKRRLCLCICLLGNCELLLMDEPTDDLDALEHSHLFQTLNRVKDTGQAILLTVDSAKESIDVTDKIVIIEDGEIQAIGTPAELFDKYAQGWIIVLRLREDNEKRLKPGQITDKAEFVHNFIFSELSPSTLKDVKTNYMLFHISDASKSLSEIYAKLEELTTILSDFIDAYIVDEMDLDDVTGTIHEEHQLRIHSQISRTHSVDSSIYSILSAQLEV